jgi:deazaflavin-dependent oxidoreductase (nitroreductase family)
VLKIATPVNNVLFRWTGGRVGGTFIGGAPIGLFTTVGRKSGQRRTVPLLYLQRGDDLVIVASQGGMPHHPAWYLNLRENPAVTVETRRGKGEYVARVVDADEKAELWPELLAMYKDYDAYQARTDRDIPVIVCSPAG